MFMPSLKERFRFYRTALEQRNYVLASDGKNAVERRNEFADSLKLLQIPFQMKTADQDFVKLSIVTMGEEIWFSPNVGKEKLVDNVTLERLKLKKT